MKKRQRAEFEAPLQAIIVSQEEKAFSLLSNGPDSVDAADPVRQHTYWPAFTEIWRAAKESRRPRELSALGKSPSPASGTAGRTTSPPAASTQSSAIPPWDKIKLQEVEWFANRVLLKLHSRLWPPNDADGIKKVARRGRSPGQPNSTLLSCVPTASANWYAPAGQYPLLGVSATSTSTHSSSSALCGLIKPDGIVGLTHPLRHLRRPNRCPLSSKPFPLVDGSLAIFDFKNSRIGTDNPPFFPGTFTTPNSNSVPSSSAVRIAKFAETECAFLS